MCYEIGLCVDRCVTVFHRKCFSVVYSLVKIYTVLSRNDVIHYLQISGTFDTMWPFWLHHPIHAYFIVLSERLDAFGCTLKM